MSAGIARVGGGGRKGGRVAGLGVGGGARNERGVPGSDATRTVTVGAGKRGWRPPPALLVWLLQQPTAAARSAGGADLGQVT